MRMITHREENDDSADLYAIYGDFLLVSVLGSC